MVNPTLHLLLGFGRLRLFLRATALSSFLLLVATGSSLAQTLTVLHNFTGGQDGGVPFAGLTMDAGGNLYGATAEGGIEPCPSHQDYGCGIVFKLTPSEPTGRSARCMRSRVATMAPIRSVA